MTFKEEAEKVFKDLIITPEAMRELKLDNELKRLEKEFIIDTSNEYQRGRLATIKEYSNKMFYWTNLLYNKQELSKGGFKKIREIIENIGIELLGAGE